MIAPFSAVTIPVDVSETAQHGIEYVLSVAPRRAKLHFCSVVDESSACYADSMGAAIDPMPMIEAMESEANSACAGAVAQARGRGFEADGNVRFGGVSTTIDQLVRENKSEAIVICTHARTGLKRFIAGSYTEALLASSDVPIIVAHLDDDASGAGAITVATDGSEGATTALHTAIAIARANGRSLSVLSVAADAFDLSEAEKVLEDAAAIVRAADVAFELVTLHGHVADTIVENARRRDSPMVVVGTRGRSALARAFLGSVATAVLERAQMPVTVVQHR